MSIRWSIGSEYAKIRVLSGGLGGYVVHDGLQEIHTR
jgi:hypothetical protein